jgi:hypothetical protein
MVLVAEIGHEVEPPAEGLDIAVDDLERGDLTVLDLQPRSSPCRAVAGRNMPCRPRASYHSKNYSGRIDAVKVDKLSVSFDPELGDAVRSAAAEAGKPLSAWLAEAAASKLRAEALARFLDGWEAEHGVLTADELARAEQELGVAASDSAA